MGGATALDGSMAMQCQSCHGSMRSVGSSQRVGWFMEPNCQQCHTGTATSNSGQIRYTSAFTDTNSTASQTQTGTVTIQPPLSMSLQATTDTVSLAWPVSSADTILEYTSALDGSAPWVAVTNMPTPGNNSLQVALPKAGAGYFRSRRSW